MFGIEKWLGHGVVRAGFDFLVEALDFAVEIIGYRIERDANREIGCAASSFSRTVGALIQAM